MMSSPQRDTIKHLIIIGGTSSLLCNVQCHWNRFNINATLVGIHMVTYTGASFRFRSQYAGFAYFSRKDLNMKT
jgi:hypothetical protein